MLNSTPSTHMIKLVVGINDLDTYAAMMPQFLVPYKGGRANAVWTRYRPKRFEELLDGGSIYRVIGGRIVCRQNIIGFEEAQHPHKGTMCKIMCAPEIVTTIATPKRAFQGWRYLKPQDAPKDKGVYNENDSQDAPPADMADMLTEAGLL